MNRLPTLALPGTMVLAAAGPLFLIACSPRADVDSRAQPPVEPAPPCYVKATDREASAIGTDPARPDSTGIRSYAFHLVGDSDAVRLAIVIDYIDGLGGPQKKTPFLMEGESFGIDGRFTIESLQPRMTTWGDSRSGVAALVLVKEGVVRDRLDGARYSLRSDGRRCFFGRLE